MLRNNVEESRKQLSGIKRLLTRAIVLKTDHHMGHEEKKSLIDIRKKMLSEIDCKYGKKCQYGNICLYRHQESQTGSQQNIIESGVRPKAVSTNNKDHCKAEWTVDMAPNVEPKIVSTSIKRPNKDHCETAWTVDMGPIVETKVVSTSIKRPNKNPDRRTVDLGPNITTSSVHSDTPNLHQEGQCVDMNLVFDRLPNVAAIDSADFESMEDLIRHIVREKVHRALNPEPTTPEPSSLKEIIREEIEKNVAAISKPIQRPPPRQSYPNQTRTFNQVPRRQYPTQTPIYNQTPPQRRTDEWRTHDNIPICFNCGRPGHVKRYCRERRQWTQRPEGHAPSTQEPQMGSSFSVISDGLRRQLKKTMFKDSGMTLKVADGKNVTSIGRCTISLSINGLEQPLEFIVLPNSNPSIILGWDFLEASNAVIDCGRAEIRLEEAKDVLNSPASMGKVVASRSVVIPAESTKIINVMSEELNGQNQEKFLEEAYNDEDDDIPSITALTCFEAEQRKDPKISKLIEETERFGAESKGYEMLKGTLYKKNFDPLGNQHLLVIPKHLRLELLKSLHDAPTAGHLGFSKIYERVKNKYFWPGILQDIRKYVAHCKECQRKKQSTQKPPGLLKAIPPATSPFQRVGMDLLGRFPKSDTGNKWIIVCTDYLTRFAVTKALPTGETMEAAKFLMEDIVLKHGAPREIITDRGRVFQSKLIAELTNQCSSIHRFTTAYHPQTNGLTERLNKTLANMIAMYVSVEQKDWDVILPYVTFAYNTAKQDTTGFTPFKLIHGREVETTVDTLFPNPHEDLQEDYSQKIASRVEETRQLARLETLKAQEKDKARYDSKHEAMDYNVGDLVWIFIPIRKVGLSEKLMKRYFGPYRVARKLSDVTFEVEPVDQPTRRRQTRDLVHVLRMKPPTMTLRTKLICSSDNYSGTLYQFKEYNEETETFETFYERLEQFLILEEAGDEKKKAYLLTLMGSKTYGVLKNLCSPILPKDKTFDNLIDILKRHFSPKRSIVVERFIFFKRMQLKEESISDYLVEIKRLASSCNFGNFLEDSLRDKMVCGLYNAKIQNRILSEGDISLAKVIEIALSMEAAEKNTKLFHLEQGEDCVDKLRMERKVESNFQNGKCKHCGKQHKELCRFKEAICFKCNKKGHIASICWSSRRNLRQHQNQPGNIHQIGDQEEEEEYVQKIISVTIPEYKINFASSDPPYLMELKVEGNFIKFEMDTGSGLTLISEKDFKNSLQHLKLEKASIIVRTYDGTVVPILGKINVKVECQDITYKLRALVVKGEKRALMGREWINRLKLGCFAVKHMPVEITIEEILKENQALFVETTEPIKGFTFSVNMCDVNPIFHKARPVPFAIRPAVTEALDKMVAKGYLCEVASSKWATPVVVVPKKNKEIRICCDFKVTLNKYLDTAAYPLPTQQDLFSTLAKGKYFSKLDLRNAYLQLEVDPGTRPLLTINTHKGLFRFKRMPFGLANAPSYFQSVMDRVLSGIGGVICYIDDVLIATASIEEHLALLKTIFARLAKYNIKLKKEKCLFLQKEIEYLGHLVTEEGIRPLDHKVQAIQKAKTPTNISELRSFLGLVNFYGKFIPNLPELLKPLHELLHKKRPWVWTKECGEAIDKCKNSITSERVLVPYDATLPLCLATDASQIGVGAVLSHIIEGQERPIMFASRTLSVAEQNYSQIEKEALAIIYGVTKFHQFIYGRKFILITDHKPLVTILGSRSGIPTLSTSRLQRWALILSAYTYDIKFRRTQDHGNADLLSRFPVGCEEIPRLNNVYALSYVEELPITAEEIATETEKDEVLSLAKFYTQQGWPEKVADHLRPYFQRKLELTVDGECLVWGMRVVIPPSLRIKMLNCLHETHSGMNKMKAVARSHFWWPNLDTQIEFLVNKCRSCQQSQDGPNKGKWQPWKWSTRPWQRIHIDFANKENINLLIVVDSHSKWIEAIPMRETTTRKTIEQLRRLFSSYGLPEELVSDNGPQFTGSEMKGFLEGNGIKQTLIPAYHPQSNGLAERAVRTIKTALDKNKRKIGDTIQDTLSKVLLAYRSTPHVTTGKTPSELFIGRALRTRVSLIHPSLASRVRDQQARQMKYDRRTHLEEFQIDDLVWCKNFRGGDKWIPGKIVGKKGTRVYTILIHGQVKAYHRDQIRKRWRNGEEDESGDGERQPENSRGAGPSAIISEVVRDRGYMESLSPGLTSQRSDQDSEVQSDTDDGKSLEPLRSLDPEALKEEGPVLRRNPPRARRPP
ncbi:K02A2.6-like, partial [Cordylochernes scorpioides]